MVPSCVIQLLIHLKIFNRKLLVSKGNAGTKKWSRDWKKGHPEIAPPCHPFHPQTPNLDTIANAKKWLQIGSWNRYPVIGCTSTWLKQMKILTANHWTEPGNTNGRVRGKTKGAEGGCNPIGRTKISTNWTPQSSHELTTNQRVIMIGSMAPITYVAEDGLICHQW